MAMIQPHEGLCSALNYGLNLARGHYIARMDADDLNAPTRLSAQLEFLRKKPGITCAGTAVAVKPLDTKRKAPEADGAQQSKAQRERVLAFPCEPLAVHWTLFFYCPLAHPSVMFNRKLLDQLSRPVYRESSLGAAGVAKAEGEDKLSSSETKQTTESVKMNAGANRSTKSAEPPRFLHCEDFSLWHRLAAEGHR
mmetsp:Transcript_22317/g.41908  ORF Transcript_22317/g.41908 Transcript_22317/m.41908 type:complete len:195 (-) Transcript_22317:726-1310(-)